MSRLSLSALQDIIAPAITALGFELWGCELYPRGHRSLLRVYIDSEQGVTVDNCARANRQINALLNVEYPLADNFEVEVSSPGLDRQLFTLDQYQRFIGRQVRIRLLNPLEMRRNFVGELKAVEADKIHLIVDGNLVVLSLENVEKANLLPHA